MKETRKPPTPATLLATFLGLSTLLNPALCEDNIVRLYNASDFINFVDAVNSGTSYMKTTVLLEDAIDLSGHSGLSSPIGVNEPNSFAGTFDGQGYWITSLKLKTTNRYAGLFGYARGATVKNLVFSANNVINVVRNAFDTSNDKIYTGSIVGYCEKDGDYCRIENSVNLANVTFTGESNGKVYIGGIVGYINSKHESHIRNCANYGLVASYGKSNFVGIGGIIGYYLGTSPNTLTVSNCLNLGTIYFEKENIDSWYAGGIVGQSDYCTYDNCVSAGEVMTTEKKSITIGSLAGKSTYTTFKNCYWNEEIGEIVEGTETVECASYNKSTFVLSKNITTGGYIGDNLLDALNKAVDYYVLYEYSHWGYSKGQYGIDFTINGRSKHFYPDSQLFLLPGLSSDGSLTFDGWYTDEAYTKPLSEYIFTSDVKVYGRWGMNTNTYSISFDTRGGSTIVSPVIGRFNSKITLPDGVEKDHCMLSWWENDYGDKVDWSFTVPAHNTTLHAVWACTKIRTASDLVGLAKVVNSGTSYSKQIVTLENDIEFTDSESEQFEPIGINDHKNYEGIFDGQGYTIRNLKLKTTIGSTGVFGYSKGTTIRNLVMDSTCSVVSTYRSFSSTDEESFFGAFIGYCETSNENCTIENCVNMASVTFDGDSNTNIFVGGLVGYFMSKQNYRSNIINCVNYGTVSHTGKTAAYADVGGLIGGCVGGVKGAFIYNNVNYGAVRNVGEYKTPSLGGITGYSVENTNYANCVNLGKIDTDPDRVGEYVGSIVGEIYTGSTIKNCYWDTSVGYPGAGSPDSTAVISNITGFDSKTFELTSSVTVGGYEGKSLIKVLESYVGMDPDMNYSKWALNRNEATVTLMIGNRAAPFLVLDSKVVLISTIRNAQNGTFFGWFTDSNYTRYFNSAEFTKNTTLYGFFDQKKEGDHSKLAAYIALNTVVVIITILGIAIIAVIIGMFLWNKFKYKFKAKQEVHKLMDPLVLNRPANSIEFLDLYPADYKKPSLMNALINAGIGSDKAESLSLACYRHADNLSEAKKLPKGVTLDDAAAIALYTMEADNLEEKPYKLINEALMKGDLEALEPVKDLLCIVMSALRKMPIVYNKPLYRGIRNNIYNEISDDDNNIASIISSTGTGSDNREPDSGIGDRRSRTSNQRIMFYRGGESFDGDYLEEEEVLWSALSSTSPNIAVTKAFLAKGSQTGKAEGTLFIIENGWGYNVQPCSVFPGEEEIVLEPERRFRVKTVIPGEGLTVIRMEMLKTPLVLPDVFGKSKGKASNTVPSAEPDTHAHRTAHRFLSRIKWI